MIYRLQADGLAPIAALPEAKEEKALVIYSFEELERAQEELELATSLAQVCLNERVTKFESHPGFDFMTLNIPVEGEGEPAQRICIYLREGVLAFLCGTPQVAQEVLVAFQTIEAGRLTLPHLLFHFFQSLTGEDADKLEVIEQQIEELEEALITGEKENCIREIITLRRRLMRLKRYYEQLLAICEALEENENGLLPQKSLRYFRMMTGRVSRLCAAVLNLRDYVTQVREAYQAQVDINLNQIMKFFTVITTIFLPLTLIAGWYGMNLKMPEYGWAFGYPLVILLSIIVVVLCFIHFKKRRWF